MTPADLDPTGTRDPDAPVRLFLVDDQELVRAGFRMVLDATPDMEVVGEAADGRAAVDALRGDGSPFAGRVDVVLMDIRMPRLDGVGATTELLADNPGAPKVVVLTTFDLDEYVYAALRAGASGFLLKDAGPADLLTAIRAVHRGDAVLAPSTTRRLLETFSGLDASGPGDPAGRPGPAGPTDTGSTDTGSSHGGPDPASTPPDPATVPELAALTPREVEVLTCVGRGLTNAEICAELYLAEATVKTHIGRILAKCGLRDRVQMVLLAYDTGLVTVRPRS